MQVAAMSPRYVTEADIPEAEREAKRAEFLAAAKNDPKNAKKPEEILAKIIEGQIAKYFEELVLVKQTFWKDGELTIEELVKNHIAKLGENIVVRQFKRVELGLGE